MNACRHRLLLAPVAGGAQECHARSAPPPPQSPGVPLRGLVQQKARLLFLTLEGLQPARGGCMSYLYSNRPGAAVSVAARSVVT